MELLTIISEICGIGSFLVSLFVASKVIKINQEIHQNGRDNIAAGRDVNVRR